MKEIIVTINGNKITPDLSDIQRLMDENPDWNRSRLSQALCELWNWQGPNGCLKDRDRGELGAELKTRYDTMVRQGFDANPLPEETPSRKRGRRKQTEAQNLLCRLRDFKKTIRQKVAQASRLRFIFLMYSA